MPDHDTPNYLAVLLAHIEAIRLTLTPGTMTFAMVRHDDWCAMLAGTGPCNCSPDVVSGPPLRPPNRRERRHRGREK